MTTPSDATSASLGHFIDSQIWNEAVGLLKFQLSQKRQNRHFNTLSMYYYENVSTDIDFLNEESYFIERVTNDLFYGLEEEFKLFTYLLPKQGLGLRNYKFFSLPLRLVYYSMGLYLVKLSQDMIDHYRPLNKHIHSYYGGLLRFSDEKLNLKPSSVYYKRSYKRFRYHVRKEAATNPLNRVVMRLDIKDYFDEISIPILLNFISEEVRPNIQAQLNYDDATKESISFFFRYISENRGGIPQSDNDVVGSFIGYLYLLFADFAFDTEIRRENDLLESHSIVRYMDDVYIFLEFKDEIRTSERELFVESLSSRIADILFHRLRLKSLFRNSTTRQSLEHEMERREIDPGFAAFWN